MRRRDAKRTSRGDVINVRGTATWAARMGAFKERVKRDMVDYGMVEASIVEYSMVRYSI